MIAASATAAMALRSMQQFRRQGASSPALVRGEEVVVYDSPTITVPPSIEDRDDSEDSEESSQACDNWQEGALSEEGGHFL